MKDDILPPRQAKTKVKKKPAVISQPPPVIIKPGGKANMPIKPLENIEETAKRVSLSKIRRNFRPKHWYNLNKEEQIELLAGLSYYTCRQPLFLDPKTSANNRCGQCADC
jgi:hypothetical protein